jgi:hypothetical protein
MEGANRMPSQQLKPFQVVIAVRLLYASLGITVLNLCLQLVRPPAAEAPLGSTAFDLILICGLQVYLITRIARGMDWARLTYLVWLIISLAYSIFLFFPVLRASSSSLWLQTFLADLPVGILSLAQNVLEIVALVLLFQGASDQWFRSQKMH